MIRVALLVIVALVAAPLASAQKAIKGDWISLGDVAPVTGDAAGILIGSAPPPGQTLALDPAFVVSVAKKNGIILAIPLDQPIMVTRANSGSAPQAKAANPARQANPAPQIGSTNGAPAQVLIFARDVARGQKLSDADLGWADPADARNPRALMDPTLALGMETKRALKSGQPVLAMDLKQPSLVRKGEQVKLVYASQGLLLTVQGVAQGDAAKGESVRVLNTYSKRTVDAVADADGIATVSRN